MLSILFPFLLIGCGEKEENYQFGNTNSAEPSQSEASQPEANEPENTPSDESNGEALYNQHCANCHGIDGSGVDDVGPSFLNELHHSDAELIEVMLEGRGSMPPTPITQEEAESIMEYIRTNF